MTNHEVAFYLCSKCGKRCYGPTESYTYCPYCGSTEIKEQTRQELEQFLNMMRQLELHEGEPA